MKEQFNDIMIKYKFKALINSIHNT